MTQGRMLPLKTSTIYSSTVYIQEKDFCAIVDVQSVCVVSQALSSGDSESLKSNTHFARRAQLATKHSASSFRAAMDFANLPASDAGACVFFDDSVKNIATASNVGWRPVLVGLVGRDCGAPVICDEAEKSIQSIHSLFDAIPELERRVVN